LTVRRKRIVLLGAGALLLAALCFAAFHEHEPVCRGKPLSKWLLEATQTSDLHNSGADDAVREMGTNTLPLLLKWLAYDPPAWRTRMTGIYNAFPKALRNSSLLDLVAGKRSVQLHAASVWAFHMLGPEAAPAVPELIRILERNPSRYISESVMLCLGAIGEKARPALPTLDKLRHSSDPALVRAATIAIQQIAPEATEDRIMR
jgi:hypothetical protein